MTALLTFAAWLTALLFDLLSVAMAGCFFLISPAFRHQVRARWTRQACLRP